MGNGEGGDAIMVGYALAPKKVDSLITPSLITYAHEYDGGRGIYLIPVDLQRPLINQGPFHCLLHKIYTDDWNHQLLDYKSKYPNVIIIDSPDAIKRLHDRISMLDVVTQVPLSPFQVTFGVPKQIVVDDNVDNAHSQLLNANLSFPVIAKPLVADGSAKSHELSLVFNAQGLMKLRALLVLQEFVNHGGVVFKVYVAGNQVKCVKRGSLPDISSEMEMESQAQEGILSFSQISNLAMPDDKDTNCLEKAEMPPLDFVEFMAKELRQILTLHLFNFDMIRDGTRLEENRYLIIDINYFPGYAKLPDYESMLTDFLYDTVIKHIHDDNLGKATEPRG